MDEYAKEIGDLQAQVDQLVDAEGDQATIAELEMQLEVLKAIYRQVISLLEAGEEDIELRRALAIRGYGPWTLDNVYAFVYEQAVELPGSGHQAFLGGIRETDFAALLAS
jgi:hypothetical protein